MLPRQEAALKLKAVAANAQILAEKLESGKIWHQEAMPEAKRIASDASQASTLITNDKRWASADR